MSYSIHRGSWVFKCFFSSSMLCRLVQPHPALRDKISSSAIPLFHDPLLQPDYDISSCQYFSYTMQFIYVPTRMQILANFRDFEALLRRWHQYGSQIQTDRVTCDQSCINLSKVVFHVHDFSVIGIQIKYFFLLFGPNGLTIFIDLITSICLTHKCSICVLKKSISHDKRMN